MAAGAFVVAGFVVLIALMPSLQSALAGLFAERSGPVERGIAYGAHVRQRLDVYYPETASARSSGPIVIFIYGGSWRMGSRGLYAFFGAALAKQGITTVIPDYRLYPEVRFPAFVEDAALAYRWTAETIARTPDGRNRPIVLAGHSAGAHIAALLAFDARYIAAAREDLPKPAGLVGLAGPYAFNPVTWPATAPIFASARSPDEARPVARVGAGAPPALLLHGLDDDIVKLWNAKELAKALRAQGTPVRVVELHGIGHFGIVLAIAGPLRWRGPVLDETVAFVRDLAGQDGGTRVTTRDTE